MPGVPREVAARLRRPAPVGHAVVEGSLPVVSFGDYRGATVATLALNPSSIEFLDGSAHWLPDDQRRLASLHSLGLGHPEDLTDADVARAFDESNTYFGRNPYQQWFHWLETMLQATGLGSYHAGTACHLDLVQWATRPAQGKLPTSVWQGLVDADRDFLAWQLGQTPATTVLVNGAACVEWLSLEGLVVWQHLPPLVFRNANGTTAQLQVCVADQDGRRFVGWNRPLAGRIPAPGRQLLREWLVSVTSPRA
jgi:hypothetical protein